MPNRAAFAARASARSGRGSGFRVVSCRAEGPVRVPATGAVRRIARHGRRAAPSAHARRNPAAMPGHAARPRARHRVFVAPRAARRGALRASTTIHETHAYASPTQRKPSSLRCRGRFVAFLWDGSGQILQFLAKILAISGLFLGSIPRKGFAFALRATTKGKLRKLA